MPPEVRAVALALVNAMGNLAQMYVAESHLLQGLQEPHANVSNSYGAYLFPAEDAPKYLKGFGVITAMLGVGVCSYAVMHVLVRRKERAGTL